MPKSPIESEAASEMNLDLVRGGINADLRTGGNEFSNVPRPPRSGKSGVKKNKEAMAESQRLSDLKSIYS